VFKKISNRSAYDILRCPQRLPKCYELTDQEREEAIRRVDRILCERIVKQTLGEKNVNA
jgi:hypothetical protein